MTIYVHKPADTRFHVCCDQCRTDRIALTHNEARQDAQRHHQWHQQKAGR